MRSSARFRFRFVFQALVLLALRQACATVSIEFQFGSIAWPRGSIGVLVADPVGDGFATVAEATGTTLSAGQSYGGGNDRIVAVFSIGDLADWGGQRGFAVLLEGIDYAALGVGPGQPLQFVGFPDRDPGEMIRANEAHGEFRTVDSSRFSGNMGFVLPADGGAYQLAVTGMEQGGTVDFSEFGTPIPDIALEELPGSGLESGGSIDFGSHFPKTGAVKSYRLRNLGRGLLTGLSVSQSGPGASAFEVSPLGVSELAGGASASFTVTFRPEIAGTLASSLQIVSNDIDEGVFVLNLSGSGLPDPRLGKTVRDPGQPETDGGSVDLAWEDSLAGTYDGLLLRETGRELVGNLSSARLTRPATGAGSGGLFTAVLRLQGRSATLRGVFDGAGELHIDLPQRDGSTVEVDLRLARKTGTNAEVLRGTVAWNGVIAKVEADRAAVLVPATIPGGYTMLLPSEPGWGSAEPGGDGWATVAIKSGGSVSLKGVLGDGTAITETGFLSANQDFCLYTELYRSMPMRGRIGGKIKVREILGVSDFDGRLQWRKFSDGRESRYKTGFEIEVWALGSRYTAAGVNSRVLSQLQNQYHNAELSLIGLPTAGAVDRVLTWTATNRLVHYGPERLGGTVDRRTGAVSGSFVDPSTRAEIRFTGVAFQKQGRVGGIFLHGAASGAVRILPGNYPPAKPVGPLARISLPGSAPIDPSSVATSFTDNARGVYQGVLVETMSGGIAGALETVTIAAGGGISGTLWVDGRRSAFRGILGADGRVTIAQPGGTLTLRLELATGTTDGFCLKGSLGDLSVDAQRRPLFSTSNRAPQEGRYTLAMKASGGVQVVPQPTGDGCGALLVQFSGACTGTFILADGTSLTLAGSVSRLGEWSFHRAISPSGSGGFVAGKLTFRAVPSVSQVDGSWRWVRPESTRPGALFPAGFSTTRAVIGCRYTPPAVRVRAFPGLRDGNFNIWFRFADSGLGLIEHAGTWSDANRVFSYGPEVFSVNFNRSTGLVTGTYRDATDPQAPVAASFAGSLLQTQGLVSGFHRSGVHHGFFGIEPKDAD